ncbi:hypothetical protein FE848_05765 [Marinobacter sp. 1-3A]|uniref:hypothetical protein n=1 Tax=Marinobacter sp. 1-3A TaxID=2582920 RepID=UPI001907445E|nr:hypothetical protein [Marinobacter sp. 1-3A]MBK1872724.1 hypothetical protein [Marinobacter sp. 1-3A]
MEEKSVACIEEFGKLVAAKNYASLVREWQVHTFYAVFVNNGSEAELPALVEVHDHLAFLAGTDPEAVEAELAEYRLSAGDGNISIKPVALKELARNAAVLGAWVVWAGSDGGVVVDSILHILGLAGIAKNESGTERLYRAKLLELPANDEMGTGPVMAQRWTITTIVDDQEVGDAESWLVYDDDDGVILLNPDGSLRNGPKPRSTITSAEQALFDEWRQPLYPFPAPEQTEASDTKTDKPGHPAQAAVATPDVSIKAGRSFVRMTALTSVLIIAVLGVVVSLQ